MASRDTSGDPLADRRFAYAEAYAAAGDHGAAAELIGQALDLVPAWTAGWLALGEARERAGGDAAAAYARVLALDPADRLGAGVRLARLGLRPAEGALSPAHVAALFDAYAPRFETSLVDALGYRGPALLAEAVVARGRRRFRRMLDLGCGTGLAAVPFAPLCDRVDGVDLSAAMLAEAAGKGLYTSLTQAEIGAALAAEPDGAADLIVAADVLVYLGDLAALFGAVARVLADGGLFAATAQHQEGAPFTLGDDLRYRHAAGAIQTWAAAAGLRVPTLAEAWARHDRGEPLPGLVLVLEKPPTRP